MPEIHIRLSGSSSAMGAALASAVRQRLVMWKDSVFTRLLYVLFYSYSLFYDMIQRKSATIITSLVCVIITLFVLLLYK